jgi:Family of unknown function (DUF5329)
VHGGTAAVVRCEISHLIDYLGASGCLFNRNGTWYDAPKPFLT